MKIDRIISMILFLIQKKKVSAKELSTIFEVSMRTVYRDIDTISMAGIPIISTPGVGGGFEIPENYKIDKKVFSPNDLSTILQGLSCLPKNVRSDELTSALTKIKSFIPQKKAEEIELKANQIRIDLNPWIYNKNINSYINTIKTATEDNLQIVFKYISHNGNKTLRTVDPYQLILKNNQWYLWGYCHVRNDYRLFKICRISNLSLTNQHFELKDKKEPNLDITSDTKTVVTKIKLKVHKTILDSILDYCTFDDIIAEESDFYIVEFPFVDNDYCYGVLLSLGDKCECLEPLTIRKNFEHRIKSMELLYRN